MINEAARRDWRAAAWWLERRRPEQFARPETRRAKPPAPPVNVGVQIDLAPYAALIQTIDPADLPRLPGVVIDQPTRNTVTGDGAAGCPVAKGRRGPSATGRNPGRGHGGR